jgi:hypothetical integral membrane protein (TIGR02206 family)
VGIVLIYYAKNKCNNLQQKAIFNILGAFISLTIIAFNIYTYNLGNYNVSEDLPLFLCSFMALIIPVYTYYRKYWMYEVLFFWIVAGTLQGVITPDIANGFPVFDYFRFWIVHLGLLIAMFYATFVFNVRPKFKSIFKSIIALQFYILIMYAVNLVLNANYSYLNAKPEATSVLDYFGDWPYYVVTAQLVIIPYCLLIYLPFYIEEKIKNK